MLYTYEHLEHFLCVWIHLDELLVQSRNLEDEIKTKPELHKSTLFYHVQPFRNLNLIATVGRLIGGVQFLPVISKQNHYQTTKALIKTERCAFPNQSNNFAWKKKI